MAETLAVSIDVAPLLKALNKLENVQQTQVLETALNAGVLPLHNAIIKRAPYKTGTYKRSWHWETVKTENGYVEVHEGTDVLYGRRLEFGFMDRDSLGREYNQPARPHVRPAITETRDEVLAEISDVLTIAITKNTP